MIDTIQFDLNTNDLGNVPELLGYDPALNPYKKGKYENFKIRVYKNHQGYRVSIEGSLHVYFKGYNAGKFNFRDVKKGVFQLGEDLGIDITKGVLRRVDFGANIGVDHNPKLYNLCFHKGYRYTKNFINDGETVLFSKGRISLCFYDKKKEQIRNRTKRSKSSKSKHKNIIRYEVRLTKTLADSLKLPKSQLFVSDIYQKKNYKRLVKLWHKEYIDLKKCTFNGVYPEDFNNYDEFMFANGLMAMGSKSVSSCIGIWADTKGLKKCNMRYRKDLAEKILNRANPKNELLKELDDKILRIKKRALSFL